MLGNSFIEPRCPASVSQAWSAWQVCLVSGGAAFLTALAQASDVRAGAKNDGVALELDDLGQPQSGLRGEVEKHVIAPADPGAPVGRREDRVDLAAGQEMHLAFVV